jgi:5-methylthioadenosine/S-adenosylhomocysteine deaminase
VDLLIANGTVVTMNAARDVLRGADVLVSDGRIERVGHRLPVGKGFRRIIDATGKLVLPGFVQAHVHLCQTLFRNQADGFELLDWLRERIWPYEAAHDAASLRASARLGIAELLLGGTTTIQDMGTVHETDAIFEAAEKAGIRLTGGKAMMDAGQGVPARLRETAEASLRESARLCERWHGAGNGRLRYAYSPRFVLSCSEGLLRNAAQEARLRKARLHTHASENAHECQTVREKTGHDNVDYLHRLGISGPDVSLAHGIWLAAREPRLLAESGTHLVHCPSANLKLASGIAKVPELLQAGVSLAIGADGAACNNSLDVFLEMRLAALLQMTRLGPRAIEPRQVVELATIGGARALGLENECGSVDPGRRADLCILDADQPHLLPHGDDVYGQIVYCARPSDVRHVIVDGEVLVADRELVTMDLDSVVADAKEQWPKLSHRAGV